MNSSNTGQQLRYLEEVCISLHRAGFETKPPEDCHLPILWNDAPLCRITGKGSVYYRREDTDTPQAEDALFRIEDIAAKTLEYMTAMETAPRLTVFSSGLDRCNRRATKETVVPCTTSETIVMKNTTLKIIFDPSTPATTG